MASIDRRPNGKWRARWREYPGGPQRARHFARKIDAERFLVDVEHRLLAGSYVPPAAGRMRVEDFAAEWMARRRPGWRDSTAQRYERELRLHVFPKLGDWPLVAVRREHIERWAADLPLKASSVAAAAQTLCALFSAAIEDGRLAANPVSGARLPQVVNAPVVPLTGDEVRRFAAGAPEHVRAAVLVAAGTGLRQGELFGLTVDRVDFLRRELRVDRQLWTPRRGPAVLAPPKTANSFRTVAMSSVVAAGLSAHLATFGPRPDGLVFHTPPGGMIVRAQASTYARRAGLASGLGRLVEVEDKKRMRYAGPGWHDLRHHHASVLLSKGVSPALVAERLGHDLKTLMRTYAHVVRQDDERVRTIVDETLGSDAEDWLRTDTG
ncbi:MAG TPA: site-specific integrase [Acidimicrobiales bacterium]|nr:site-specific integrase [Acidimicrobiales bacterium]